MESLDIYFKVRYLLSEWNQELEDLPYERKDFFHKDHVEKDEFRLILSTMGGQAVDVRFMDFRVETRQEKYAYIDPEYQLGLSFSLESSSVEIGPKVLEADLFFENKLAGHSFKATRTDMKIPRKFRATQFEVSGGGWYSAPVRVPSVYTEEKEHIHTQFDINGAIETYLNSVEWVLQQIKNRIYINDLYINSYKVNYKKEYQVSERFKESLSDLYYFNNIK